jgi:hypothetical protein
MTHNQPTTRWISHCTPELLTEGWHRRNSSRPLYILLLGLEGSGHHMTHQALHNFTDSTQIYTPGLYNWDNKTAPYTFTEAEDLERALLEQNWFEPNTPSIYLDGQNSCPSGGAGLVRSPYRCPDPFLWLQLEAQGLLDVKFIFLGRDFGDCVFSALRRKFTTSAGMQLRLEEFSASYLTSALHALPCSHTYLLPYTNAFSHSRSLMDFLEMNGTANFKEFEARTTPPSLGRKWKSICPWGRDEEECTVEVREEIEEFERVHRGQWDWLNI